MRLIKLVAILGFVLSGHAQEYTELPKIVPSSADVASLMKFNETPVSFSTGVPQISIPIYNIQNADINVPISLSYHASGVKVEEISSWVGLGWSLRAGGVVTRSVRGIPDDSYNGFINTSHTISEFLNLDHSVYGENRYYQIVESNLGYRDYEPDVFNFNFGEYSGRFIYDQTQQKFIQTEYTNLKIKPIYNSDNEISSFVILSPDGFRYYFGENSNGSITATDSNPISNSYSYNNGNMSIPNSGVGIDHVTTWHLTEIISPKNNKVVFEYQSQFGNVTYRTGEQFISGGCDVKGYSTSFQDNFEQISNLKSIKFPGGSVDFILDDEFRLDNGRKALNRIEVILDDSVFKTYQLSQSYFNAKPGTGDWSSIGNNPEYREYRLKLDSLKEINPAGESHPPYEFTYNNTALPNRFSNAQDYWGYYNGQDSNESLIPEIEATYYETGTLVYYGNANRTVDPNFAKAGILESIKYPTGGTTQYIYESNVTSINLSKGGSPFDVRSKTQTKSATFAKSDNLYNDTTMMYEMEFTIGEATQGQIQITTSVSGCDNSNPLTNFECDYILNVNGLTNDESFSISKTNVKTTLEPGVYKVTAMPAGLGETQNPSFSSIFMWEELVKENDPNDPDYVGSVVGGQRIKKIIIDDGGGNLIEKSYDYSKFGSSLSSGTLISNPVYVDPTYYNGSCDAGNYSNEVYKITSITQAPSININGSPVGYANVTEILGGKIKTEYTFNIPGDFPHSGSISYGNVLLPDNYSDWRRGVLEKKKEYKYENGSYIPVRQTSIEKEVYGAYTIPNHGIKIVPTIGSSGIFTCKYASYSGRSEWYRDKKITTTEFHSNGNLVTEKIFSYNSNPLLASEIESHTGDRKISRQRLYYPEEIFDAGNLGYDNLTTEELNAINRMKDPNEHIINKVIQKEKSVFNLSGDLLAKSAKRTNYSIVNGIILPKSIQSSKAGEFFEDRILFFKYDESGNPLEVSKNFGSHIIYLWGYEDKYPIAKIQNVTFSEISNLLGDLSRIDESDFLAIDDLRESLPDANVTTFKYTPNIGMTKKTDSRNISTYYSFDDFGRLKQIKDNENAILKSYEYHYKD